MHLRSQGCQAVVSIHQDVDGGVDGCTKKCCGKVKEAGGLTLCLIQPSEGIHTTSEAHLLTLSTWDPFDSDPPEDEHGAVVVHVEEADLVELFPQDEEDCVQEFHSFGDVVPPQSRCYLKT